MKAISRPRTNPIQMLCGANIHAHGHQGRNLLQYRVVRQTEQDAAQFDHLVGGGVESCGFHINNSEQI
ncbi:hypothetical protein SPB21_03640 [Leptothoe sp. ISB3NOV94-8A]